MKQVRTAGVLLHLTSLPGPFGCGVMGEEARTFVLQLQRMGFHYWQVLPLCPVDDTGSPYCSHSANAGNLLLIDPRQLMEDGLLTEGEVRESVFADPLLSERDRSFGGTKPRRAFVGPRYNGGVSDHYPIVLWLK